MVKKKTKAKRGRPMADLTDLVFGRLLVLRHLGLDTNPKHHLWECECSCDRKKIVTRTTYLLTGGKRSCGCLAREHLWAKKYWKQRAKDEGWNKRRDEILAMYKRGMSMIKIAKHFRLSTGRVRQIIRKVLSIEEEKELV